MNWNAPEIEVTIGEKTRIGSVRTMDVVAARSQPVATASLELSNLRFEWNDGVEDGDVLKVRWGWRGKELYPLFDGSIRSAYLKETLQVEGLCRARYLADTRITRTYRNEEAGVIVANLLALNPFVESELASDSKQIDKLPLCNNTIVEALHLLNRRLELDYAFGCDPSGIFRWGLRDLAQEPVTSFTHGDDIVDFHPIPGDRYLLTAFASPVWHSQVVSIFDRQGNETRYFVEQVRHSVGIGDEGARSRLWLDEITGEQ